MIYFIQRLFSFVFLILITTLAGFAQRGGESTVIKGVVRDSISRQTIPMVTITINGSDQVFTSDMYGEFNITLPSGAKDSVNFYFLGYKELKVEIEPNKTNNIKVSLQPIDYQIEGAVVTAKRRRYVKRGNPAVELIKRLIAKNASHDPKKLFDHFDYQRYEKILLSVNNYREPKAKSLKALNNFVDTSSVTGLPSLPLSIKERVVETRVSRNKKDEVLLVRRSEGIDEKLSEQNIESILKVVFDELNIFDNDVYFVTRNFVSPFSAIAQSYYKFYLSPDTVLCDGHRCVELSFFPFNKESLGFRGQMYVQADSTDFVRRIEFSLPTKAINLNYIYDLEIIQTFDMGDKGQRIMEKDSLSFLLKLISEKDNGFIVSRINSYKDYNFEDQQPTITLQDKAALRAHSIDSLRHTPVRVAELKIDSLAKQLRKVPLLKLTEIAMVIVEQGYVGFGENSWFDLGPVTSFLSKNSLEGVRVSLNGVTTPKMIKNLFFEVGAAYGFKDHKFKYTGAVEYSFTPKRESRNEFPIHSIKAMYSYSSHRMGVPLGGEFTQDNIFSLFTRGSDSTVTYMRNAELVYWREFKSHFSYKLTARNYTQMESPVFSFAPMAGTLPSFTVSELKLSLRYAPDEKIYETKRRRRTVEFNNAIWEVSHTSGFKGVLGGDYRHNYTELGFTKRFDMSILGYADTEIKAGAQWNAVPYMLLPLANTNQSYFIMGNAYTLMNPMEFLYDRFVSWNVVWNLNGLILNRIPLIKKLKWREIVTCRGVWGTLTDKNNPQINTNLVPFPSRSGAIGHQPYVELGVGIGNIFKLFRVDYMRRLTYTDVPDLKYWSVMFGFSVKF